MTTMLLDKLLTLALPQRCAVCGLIGDSVCRACLRAFVRVAPPLCERCGSPGHWPVRRCAECWGRRLAFSTARAALVYDDRARAFVAAWKEHGRRDLVDVAADLVTAVVAPPPAEVIAFVPADDDRRLERGHAPPSALATALSGRWGVPVGHLVDRSRRVARQRGLSLAERRRNVRGAFVARARAPARVCLVDDVYTTGATANACASALRRSGARTVTVVSLARAVR
jgi:ComF family protein